jgi:hypothetical protein
MPIPNQECVVFQLFSLLKTQMVELLIGFVCFCGLSLLNAPWSTVPLLLPLFDFNKTSSFLCSRSSFVGRALTVRPVMLLLVFFLVLQNRTIGFEIKSLVLGLFDPCISRSEQR